MQNTIPCIPRSTLAATCLPRALPSRTQTQFYPVIPRSSITPAVPSPAPQPASPTGSPPHDFASPNTPIILSSSFYTLARSIHLPKKQDPDARLHRQSVRAKYICPSHAQIKAAEEISISELPTQSTAKQSILPRKHFALGERQ